MTSTINQDDIIYFIVTDRFFGKNKQSVTPSDNTIHGGTLDGIVEKLDYLLTLGVTAIWITPVYKNVSDFFGTEPYHYYWAEDFTQIDERLLDGSHLPLSTDQSTLAFFIQHCESKGMKVILDMVINHAGYGAETHFSADWFNHGPSWDTIKGPLSGLPDFNHDNPAVLDYFINNIQDWITHGQVSNIRMDTVKHVEPKFWHYFKAQIRGQYPYITLLGEVLSQRKEDIKELLEYQNYHDFDSLFDFPLATALRSTLIYDEPIRNWLARPRLQEDEPTGVLDNDNPLKGGYRNANGLVTLLDNHDLEKRIMSHARSKHTGEGAGLEWAVRVNKLCLATLFTIRGIPQLYYGTELGMEGWKTGSNNSEDKDMRRDFPWQVIGGNHQPHPEFARESEIYHWTRDLIRLRRQNAAFRYGTTITLWSDDLVYAFLRIAADDVALAVINNGYQDMPVPLPLTLQSSVVPPRIIALITSQLRHWRTGQSPAVNNNQLLVQVPAKAIEIYCLRPLT